MPKKTASAGAHLAVVKALRKDFGPSAATLLGGGVSRAQVDEVIPTELNVIDRHVLGIGGLPVGRMSEVFSEEGVGKTSLMLHCLGTAQVNGTAILAETENALQPEWAEDVHGVDNSCLVLLEADCMEDAIAQIGGAVMALPRKAGPSLVAWDSVASCPTKQEIETGDSFPGDRARMLSRFCRRIGKELKAKRAHLMFVNQMRENIGVMFGDKWVTPGGHAIKYHSSIRLQIFPGKATKTSHGDHTGRTMKVMAVKNKLHPPWRKALVRLHYERGFDEQWSTLAHAMDRKIIPARSRGAKKYEEALKALGWSS